MKVGANNKGRLARHSDAHPNLGHLLLPVEGIVVQALLLAGQRLLLFQHLVLVRLVDFLQQVHHAWVRVQHQRAELLVAHLRNAKTTLRITDCTTTEEFYSVAT